MSALIVIRGNSRAGKSTLATCLAERIGRERTMVVGQDVVRRIILSPHGTVDVHARAVLRALVTAGLGEGLDVIAEGIWFSGHYGPVLRELVAQHAGPSLFVRLEVPFDESVRRLADSPEAGEFTADDMRAWWRDQDPIAGVHEYVLSATEPPRELARFILQTLYAPAPPRDGG